MKSEKDKNNADSNPSFNYWYSFLRLMPKRQLTLSIFYGVFRIVVSTIWPFILYRVIKDIGTMPYTEVLLYVTAVVLLLSLAAVASQLQSKININVLRDATLELIHRIWKKMNALEWLTFHGKSRVYYFDMLMVEAWRLRGGMAALLDSLIVNSLIAGVLSLFILFISWQLFFVCLVGFILMGIGHYISTIKIRPLLKEFHDAWRTQHQWIAKSVDQFDLLKMDRDYEASAATNLKNSSSFLDVNSRLLSQREKWRNINQILGNSVRISVFVIGLFWLREGVLGLDDLLLTLLVLSIVQGNIMQIPSALHNFIEAQESLKTISMFFELQEEATDKQPALANFPPVKKIVIRDLSYNYGDKTAIKNLNIDLQVGKIYLWRGRNGSGKSTAAHILLGLLRPEKGRLTINDELLNWDDLRTFRERFTFLNQDSPIFMGSIKENILFGHTSPAEGWEKLKTTWLSGLLPVSSQAEHRLVGERGEGLSGGEAKRVALIRELLRSSELLILDEPLNHLDEFAINEIKREILILKSKAIIIIISHQTGFESIADEIKQF